MALKESFVPARSALISPDKVATVMLQGNGPFQSASYGFTVFSLVAMVASVLVVSSVWVGLFCYYLLVTWRNDREVNRKRVVSASSL